MYITEISYSDFKKLGLVGYRHEKKDTGRGSFKIVSAPVERLIKDEDVEYSKSFKHNLIAVFFNACTPEEAEDNIVWDKYYVRIPATYCVWCGVEHVYSEKGRWYIKADSEDGILSKRLFGKVYLIHLE